MHHRNWFNCENSEKSARKFADKYPYDFDTYINLAKTVPLKEFRCLCSMIENNCAHIPYTELMTIRDTCNNRINMQIGKEAADLYDFFSCNQKHELWQGDTRCLLFSNGIADFDSRVIIKSVVLYLVKYKNKPIEVKDLAKLSRLFNSGPNDRLYTEISTYNRDWEHNDVVFEKINKTRRRHTELWITFTNYLWNHKFQEAYDLMVANLSEDNVED